MARFPTDKCLNCESLTKDFTVQHPKRVVWWEKDKKTWQWFKSMSLANTGPPSHSPFGLLSIFVWWLFTDQNWTWSWITFPVFISWPYVWTSGQFQDKLFSRSQGFLLFFRSVYTFFIRFCWFSQPMESKRAQFICHPQVFYPTNHDLFDKYKLVSKPPARLIQKYNDVSCKHFIHIYLHFGQMFFLKIQTKLCENDAA